MGFRSQEATETPKWFNALELTACMRELNLIFSEQG